MNIRAFILAASVLALSACSETASDHPTADNQQADDSDQYVHPIEVRRGNGTYWREKWLPGIVTDKETGCQYLIDPDSGGFIRRWSNEGHVGCESAPSDREDAETQPFLSSE